MNSWLDCGTNHQWDGDGMAGNYDRCQWESPLHGCCHGTHSNLPIWPSKAIGEVLVNSWLRLLAGWSRHGETKKCVNTPTSIAYLMGREVPFGQLLGPALFSPKQPMPLESQVWMGFWGGTAGIEDTHIDGLAHHRSSFMLPDPFGSFTQQNPRPPRKQRGS